MNSFTLVVVALLALSQLGCVVNGRRGDLTPEQAALRVEPPRKREQRVSRLRSAPEGMFVIFENVADPPGDPHRVKIGVARVTLEWYGWDVRDQATVGGSPSHGILISEAWSGRPEDDAIFFGRIVDERVSHMLASFSSGQRVEDTVVDGLFGVFVVPKAILCRLELTDTQGQRVQLFDLIERDRELVEFLDVPIGPARQECQRSQENKP